MIVSHECCTTSRCFCDMHDVEFKVKLFFSKSNKQSMILAAFIVLKSSNEVRNQDNEYKNNELPVNF